MGELYKELDYDCNLSHINRDIYRNSLRFYNIFMSFTSRARLGLRDSIS